MMKMKTYSELMQYTTFKDRFNYLKLNGIVGADTFGFDRYMNQQFYKSSEWRNLRNKIILRDNGCDLGMEGYEIFGRIIIHHMNPISPKDIALGNDLLLNPNYLICVTHMTHEAITYGDINLLPPEKIVERRPYDTCPWKR